MFLLLPNSKFLVLFKSLSCWVLSVCFTLRWNEVFFYFVSFWFWFCLRIAYSAPLRLKCSPALLAGTILARITSWFPMRFCRLYLTFSSLATAKDDDLSTSTVLLPVAFWTIKNLKWLGWGGGGSNGGPYLSRSEAANPLSYVAIILCV